MFPQEKDRIDCNCDQLYEFLFSYTKINCLFFYSNIVIICFLYYHAEKKIGNSVSYPPALLIQYNIS